MALSNDDLMCWVSIISDLVNALFSCVLIPLVIFKFFESHRHMIQFRKSIAGTTLTFFSISTVAPLVWILVRAESC